MEAIPTWIVCDGTDCTSMMIFWPSLARRGCPLKKFKIVFPALFETKPGVMPRMESFLKPFNNADRNTSIS